MVEGGTRRQAGLKGYFSLFAVLSFARLLDDTLEWDLGHQKGELSGK